MFTAAIASLAPAFAVLARLWAAVRPFALYLVVAILGFALAEGFEHRGKTPAPLSWVIGQGLAQQLRDLKEADAKALAAAKARVARIETRQTAATAVAQTQAVEARAKIEYRTQTLIKEVPVYVTAQAVAGCTVTRGFVSLWNDAIRPADLPGLPGPAGGVDEPAPGVDLADVEANHVANAGVCLSQADQLTRLQDWVEQAKKIHDDADANPRR